MKSPIEVVGFLVQRRDTEDLYIARINRNPFKSKGSVVFLNGTEITQVPGKYRIDSEPVFTAKVYDEFVGVDVDVQALDWEDLEGDVDLDLARNIGYPDGREGADNMPEILREIRHLMPFRLFRSDMLDKIERAINCRIEISGDSNSIVVYRNEFSEPLFEIKPGPNPCYECRDAREVRTIFRYWEKQIGNEFRKFEQIA